MQQSEKGGKALEIGTEERPGYYAVIPANVRYDDQIPANAKLLYGEISALIGAEGYCFASNQYFANIYGMSCDTITRLISKLEKSGYIKRMLEKDNAGQVVGRKIYLTVSMPEIHPPDNFAGTPLQKNREGTCKKVGDTNLSITKKEKGKKEKSPQKPEPLTDEELRPIVVDAINALAQPSWSAAVKNDLFRWVMALYDPNRTVRKAHPVRSKLSVDGTFRKLALSGNDPQVMIGMLCTAIEGGWQGVQVPNKSGAAPPKPVQEEREYRCL